MQSALEELKAKVIECREAKQVYFVTGPLPMIVKEPGPQHHTLIEAVNTGAREY